MRRPPEFKLLCARSTRCPSNIALKEQAIRRWTRFIHSERGRRAAPAPLFFEAMAQLDVAPTIPWLRPD